MMETNKSTGGRPKDTFADPHVVRVEDKEGNVIAKKCTYCGHRFSIRTSVTRIKAHLGGVPGQGVAPCKHVPSNVKEAAKNAMPSSSSNPRPDVSVPSKSDMRQTVPQQCCTSFPPPPESMLSVREQCPRLLDDSLHQSNVYSTCLGLTVIPEGHGSQDILDHRQDDVQLRLVSSHTTDIGQLCKGIEDNLGGVPDQNVAPCENDPSNVEEAAMNALPSSSSNPVNIPSSSGLQQLPPQDCYTSVPPPPPQNMLPYGSLQQTNIELAYLEEQLNLLDVETLDGFESQENFRSYFESFSAELGPAATQQRCKNDETNFLQETLTPQDIPGMGSSSPQLPRPISESLHANPPPSSEPESDDMDIVPSSAPSDTRPTASDQTRPGNKRKFPDKVPSGKKLPIGKKNPVPTFVRKEEEIYASLQDDSVSRIGVYGMGGCGKTTVMKCIHNQLLEDRFMPFTHVVWVNVSQDHTIPKLQQNLASRLGITLAHDEDHLGRAATLYEKMEKMCYALILDDVWEDINLEEVGIPEPSQDNRCKMILTTRELGVCNKMNCSPAISLGLLSEKEAWDLFVFTLNVAPKDSIIEGIMKEVAEECACLPLAIVTVAGSMKGKIELFQWRNALDSLRRQAHGFTEMDEKVIVKLKFSYDRLSQQLQQCLLSCTLYPEDYPISRQELIGMWINEGTIWSTKSLLSAYDYGRTVINELENACLLIPDDLDRVVMHDLIRDMCLHIVGSRFLVRCGSKSPPDESEYTKDVEKVSLVQSYFKEIPSHMVPHCPELSTLLLSENYGLTRVADSFFIGLPRLKVLNLSCTSIEELPNSVTNLVSLNTLVLQFCDGLKRLPRLAPLKALKKLDLCWSGIEEAPEGLGELVNLTYLDLQFTDIRTLSSSTLGNLVKLQYLKTGRVRIMMNDVKGLKDLETFQAVFVNLEEYNGYFRSMLDSGRGPSQYDVEVYWLFRPSGIRRYASDGVVKVDLTLTSGLIRSMGDNCLSDEVIEIIIPSLEIVDTLEVNELGGNHFVISEVEREVSSSLHKSSTRLHIKQQTEESGELKCLFDAKLLLAFLNLSRLRVLRCDLIEELISTSPSVGVLSSSLTKLIIYRCDKLVRLIDLEVLSYLQNLEEIEILYCKSLESIVSTANPVEKEEESNNPISFPKLRVLCVWDLPNLRSICDCDDTLICPSIESIQVINCPKLKRLPPLQVPELDNNRRLVIEGRREWWESLEWDHPDAKTLLQPYFHVPWWLDSEEKSFSSSGYSDGESSSCSGSE